MISIVGAGSGAADLITVRGARLLGQADVIVYAGSLVNPQLLSYAKEGCEIYNSAKMTLEQVMEVIEQAWKEQKEVVRLHTGDPCLYGAIREQMDAMDKLGITYDICPGVSSFCGTAAALQMEYTLPGISQSVVITRMAGRTPVPERESIRQFASHQATMVVFLSTGMLKELSEELMAGGYTGSYCVQGYLAGRKNGTHNRSWACRSSRAGEYYKNSPDRSRKCSGTKWLRQVKTV